MLIKVKTIADFITFAKANAGFVILDNQHNFVAAWKASKGFMVQYEIYEF